MTMSHKPPLKSLISLVDVEEVAKRQFNDKAWAYFSSAATNCVTHDMNSLMYQRIWFRPRLLRNVSVVDTRTTILGCESALPFYIAPVGFAALAHLEGEVALMRACSRKMIPMCLSSNSSFSMGEVVAQSCATPKFFQLYVNKDRAKTEAILKQAQTHGFNAVLLTIDGPVPGKREADERIISNIRISSAMSEVASSNDSKGGGLTRSTGRYIDSSLEWNDLKWLRSLTDMPLILKGVQGALDAKIAMQHGITGIVISNHGGRNLDTSPPAILTLLELRKVCPEIFDVMEVHIDGGVRRGTDIVKALCLGASAIGIGRPMIYGLTYGQEGVEHVVDILRDEVETTMRLLGVTELSQLHPGMVNTLSIDHEVPGDNIDPERG